MPGSPKTNLDMSKWGLKIIWFISNIYAGFFSYRAGIVLTIRMLEKDTIVTRTLKSAQFFDFGTKNWPNRHFFIFVVQFDKVLTNLLCFIGVSVHTSAQNYIRQNSVHAEQFI